MIGQDVPMTNCKPYLLRAVHEWIEDNNCTPYLLVDANYPGVQVPFEFVKDGQIVLNVSSGATGNFCIGEKSIAFNARFGGKPRQLLIPVEAVLFLYAKENGEGMPFPAAEYPQEQPLEAVDTQPEVSSQTKDTETEKSASKGSHLKVIK